jgi:hypothetical protein
MIVLEMVMVVRVVEFVVWFLMLLFVFELVGMVLQGG